MYLERFHKKTVFIWVMFCYIQENISYTSNEEECIEFRTKKSYLLDDFVIPKIKIEDAL